MADFSRIFNTRSLERSIERTAQRAVEGVVTGQTNRTIGREVGGVMRGRGIDAGRVLEGSVRDMERNQRAQRADLTRLEREEKTVEKAEERFNQERERYANRPDALARSEQYLARAQERYLTAYEKYSVKHGNPPDHIKKPDELLKPGLDQQSRPAPSPVSRPTAPVNEPRSQAKTPEPSAATATAAIARPEPEKEAMAPTQAPAKAPAAPAADQAALSGAEIMALQAGLRLAGIDAGPVDGVAGVRTQAGMEAYARQNPGVDASDPKTVLAAVRNEMSNNPDVQTKMASVIADGGRASPQDARAVQIALNDRAGAGLDVDGKIGPRTAQAFNTHMSNTYLAGADQMDGVQKTQPQVAAAPQEPGPAGPGAFKPPAGPGMA